MRRMSVLIIVVLISSLPSLASLPEYTTENTLDVSIDPESAWSEDYNVTAFGLITVSARPENSSNVYHLTILNGTSYLIISRYNVTGDTFFNFMYEGLFRIYIWNVGEEQLIVDLSLNSDRLYEAEEVGYNFDFEENRCLQITVLSNQDYIIPIGNLTKGEYKIKVSTYDDNGKLKFYLANLNPAEEANWKENATSVSWTEYMTDDFQIDENYNWIVLSSEDGYEHTVTLVMIYNEDTSLRTQDVIVMVALFSALLLLLTTQASSRKNRRSRKSYYSTKPSREEVQKQLHLVSQVDIRHEGGRYVYIPPDLTEPDLLDEGLVDKEEKD